MSNVIAFRRPLAASPELVEIDPLTAIDVAIRDLADITGAWGTESARQQAEECGRMLREAYRQALASEAGSGPGSEG